MIFSVHQHWDPLRLCVVGRSYPPEFYSWIQVPRVRDLFERIAIETEQDYQNIIRVLDQFGVEVMRPDIPEQLDAYRIDQQWPAPPMTPRDYMIMIGDRFYCNLGHQRWQGYYSRVRRPGWPDTFSYNQFMDQAPAELVDICRDQHDLEHWYLDDSRTGAWHRACYGSILDRVSGNGNTIRHDFHNNVNGAMVSRIGRDLYFGTAFYRQDQAQFQTTLDREFTGTRNHIVNTGGHSDGTYCPVCPGLIISLHDVPTYSDTYPDWEVVYLPGQSLAQVYDFMRVKHRNHGRWWIPGFETDSAVIDVVESWLTHWVGFVEETVFDVNMLMINPTNVMLFGENDRVCEALGRYGITPHVVPFRHRYFWDGGIHCVTLDLDREGLQQDFFPARSRAT